LKEVKAVGWKQNGKLFWPLVMTSVTRARFFWKVEKGANHAGAEKKSIGGIGYRFAFH